jgi:hypothetical protein
MAVTDEQLYEFVTSSLDDFGEKANWCVSVRACVHACACVRACVRAWACVNFGVCMCAFVCARMLQRDLPLLHL